MNNGDGLVAEKLKTARTITYYFKLSGSQYDKLSASVNFDGSSNVTAEFSCEGTCTSSCVGGGDGGSGGGQ